MSAEQPIDPSFHISDRTAPSTTVVAGFSAFGLAGITAADYLVEAVDRVYDLGLDAEPLESFARTVEQYYRDLATQVETAADREVPEDRMYM